MSRKNDVLVKIKELIYNHFKPGDRLPTEFELAETFGVGRPTIRESLKVLSEMGLIIRKNSGTFVVENTVGCLIEPFNMIIRLEKKNLLYLTELREVLEMNILLLALDRVTEEGIRRLERVHWRMQNPDYRPEEFNENDFEFHNTIAQITGNPVFVELLSSVRQVIVSNNHRIAHEDPAVREMTLRCHQAIINGFKSRDAEACMAAAHEHLLRSREIRLGPDAKNHPNALSNVEILLQNAKKNTLDKTSRLTGDQTE